jgi:hypothetical protein
MTVLLQDLRERPGRHEFGRLGAKLAKESRHDVYKFLAQYLRSERPMK